MYARVYVTGGRSKQRIVLSLWLLFSVFRFCLFLNKRAFFSQFDHNQKILITIRKFWLWSENSLNKRFFSQFDHNQKILITIRKFWSQSENSDHNKNILITIRKFWSQSENSDHNQKILITIRKFWSQSENSDSWCSSWRLKVQNL